MQKTDTKHHSKPFAYSHSVPKTACACKGKKQVQGTCFLPRDSELNEEVHFIAQGKVFSLPFFKKVSPFKSTCDGAERLNIHGK